MPIVQPITVVSASKDVEAELQLWDESPEDRAKVKLRLRFGDADLEASSVDGYFRALVDLRMSLEAIGAEIRCFGACENVYPSRMIESMGYAEKAYRLSLGKPAAIADLVSIFESEPDMPLASVQAQRLFYEKWCRSLG